MFYAINFEDGTTKLAELDTCSEAPSRAIELAKEERGCECSFTVDMYDSEDAFYANL